MRPLLGLLVMVTLVDLALGWFEASDWEVLRQETMQTANAMDYTGCLEGTIHCIARPPGCVATSSCSWLFKSVWDVTNKQWIAEVFTETSGPGRYMGVALSRDPIMNNDATTSCEHFTDGRVMVRHGQNANKRYEVEPAGIPGITTVVAAVNGGIMHCKWIRNSVIFYKDKDWTLAGQIYWLLFAQGPHTNNLPAYHGADSRTANPQRIQFPL